MSSARVLVVVVAVAALGFYMLGRLDSAPEQADTPAAEAPSEPVAQKIDPTPYRRLIEAIETLVYLPEAGGFDDAGRISAKALELSMAVRGNGQDQLRHRAWGRLYDFAGALDAQADVGYAMADLSRIRSDWERVRGQVFRPASWFGVSTPAMDVAQAAPVPEVDHVTVRDLRDLADELQRTIRLGQRESGQIGEAVVDAALATPPARRSEGKWLEWSQVWREARWRACQCACRARTRT